MTPAKPIEFSTEMVEAILAGQKIQTRRLVNPRPCPYEVGGWLYVREAIQRSVFGPYAEYLAQNSRGYRQPVYSPTEPYERLVWSWKVDKLQARFAPKAASRIRLEIEAVREERLGDISENDALAEGARNWSGSQDWDTAVGNFQSLWCHVHRRKGRLQRDAWNPDAQVWVVQFRPWVAVLRRD